MTMLNSCSSELAKLFIANRDRSWYFVKPGGNWGDYLIYAGAESLARKIGLQWIDLDYQSFDPNVLPKNIGIYLHGGGGFNPWGSRRAFKNLKTALTVPSALVIQGPQTCDVSNSETKSIFLSTLSNIAADELHIFAREMTSAEFLKSILPPSIHLHLDHDTALHLNKNEILGLAKLTQSFNQKSYTLAVIRKDNEASSLENFRENVVCMDPAYYAQSFSHWLRIHAFAKKIISNRLHSAIVGTLMGKPVTLLANSYHKNYSVWEFSLKDRQVSWCDHISEKNESKQLFFRVPEVISKSWKIQRMLMWLRGVPIK